MPTTETTSFSSLGGRLLTENFFQPGWCFQNVCPALAQTKKYSDSTGRTLVVTNHKELSSVCEAAEYFRDDAGRLSEIKYATWEDSTGNCASVPTLSTLVTYTYSISTAPHISEVRAQSKTLITLTTDGLISKVEHRTPQSTGSTLITKHEYTRDANGRISQDLETRNIGGTDKTATTTYTYGAGNLASGDLASDGPIVVLLSEMEFSPPVVV